MEVLDFGMVKDGSGTMNIKRREKARARANNQPEELFFSKEESYTCIKLKLHMPSIR
jgi:hypothetical protein